jgi:hypothetical protein
MPPKTAALSLEGLWDLEDKFTAFVGRPTGAKPLPAQKVPKCAAASKSAKMATFVEGRNYRIVKHTILKKASKAGASQTVAKGKSGKYVGAKKAKTKA